METKTWAYDAKSGDVEAHLDLEGSEKISSSSNYSGKVSIKYKGTEISYSLKNMSIYTCLFDWLKNGEESIQSLFHNKKMNVGSDDISQPKPDLELKRDVITCILSLEDQVRIPHVC